MKGPGLNVALWEHQQRAVDFAKDRAGTMLAMEMGTGKTLASIALCNLWEAKRVLIVCPKSVMAVWPLEFSRYCERRYRITVLDDHYTCKKKAALLEKALAIVPSVVVTNYDSAIRTPFSDAIINQDWDVVILDEVHRCKAPGGITSRFAAKLRLHAPHRLGLTGTPIPHSPLDLYAQFRALDTSIYGTSYAMFKSRYAIMGGYGNYKVVGWINQADMKRRMAQATFRVMKREVLPDLPPVTYTERTFALVDAERTAYAQLERDFYLWVKEGIEVTTTNALTRLLRLQQLTGGFLKSDEGRVIETGHSKVDAFVEWLEDLYVPSVLDEDQTLTPFVVFCRFHHDIDACRTAIINRGWTCSELSGRVNELATWQAGETQGLVVQIQSGGLGIDLTRASQMCFFSLGFSLGEYEQALARTDRPGQINPVTVTHLVGEQTVDAKIYRALRDKKDVVESVLEVFRVGVLTDL